MKMHGKLIAQAVVAGKGGDEGRIKELENGEREKEKNKEKKMCNYSTILLRPLCHPLLPCFCVSESSTCLDTLKSVHIPVAFTIH